MLGCGSVPVWGRVNRGRDGVFKLGVYLYMGAENKKAALMAALNDWVGCLVDRLFTGINRLED